MAKKTKNDLMLTKIEIQQALDEGQKVKKQYPAFWKFYEMLLELNQGLMHLEQAMREDDKNKKVK